MIEQPYADNPNDLISNSNRNMVAFHENHGTAHALRQREFSKRYLSIIQQEGTSPHKEAALAMTEEEIACMELAAFMFRAGRTNERGGRGDPSNAERSAILFESVAKQMGFKDDLIKGMSTFMCSHMPVGDWKSGKINLKGAEKGFTAVGNVTAQQKAMVMKRILDLSHHNDLVRCWRDDNRTQISGPLQNQLDYLLGDTAKAAHTTKAMMNYAAQMCKATGAQVIAKTLSYARKDPDLAAQTASDPKNAMMRLEQITPQGLNIVAPVQPQPTQSSIPKSYFSMARRMGISKKSDVADLMNKQSLQTTAAEIKKQITGVKDTVWIFPNEGSSHAVFISFKTDAEAQSFANELVKVGISSVKNPGSPKTVQHKNQYAGIYLTQHQYQALNTDLKSGAFHHTINKQSLQTTAAEIKKQITGVKDTVWIFPNEGSSHAVFISFKTDAEAQSFANELVKVGISSVKNPGSPKTVQHKNQYAGIYLTQHQYQVLNTALKSGAFHQKISIPEASNIRDIQITNDNGQYQLVFDSNQLDDAERFLLDQFGEGGEGYFEGDLYNLANSKQQQTSFTMEYSNLTTLQAAVQRIGSDTLREKLEAMIDENFGSGSKFTL
ncbi:SidE phosphodiesterase domain-containing protein [Legionella israelensis]|nr:SidE phosphodiesterase domain-containing protein [Legionella israelensis]